MLIKRSQQKNYERNRFCGQNSIWGSYRDWLLNLYLKNNTGRNHRHLFVQKIRGNTLSPFDPFSETCDFSQIQWIKSQKWLTRTDSPAYHCVVLSSSYWIVLKVLVAIQFRQGVRGESCLTWPFRRRFSIAKSRRIVRIESEKSGICHSKIVHS